MSEVISNITNEILFVGSIYKNPDLLVEYGTYVRSKYDFADEATRFFYDNAEIMYKNHSQTFNKTSILTYFSSEPEKLSQYKKYGGYKIISQWTELAITDDIAKTFEVLKKYSLLREYQRQGFNIERIVKHKKFDTFTANDIFRLVRGMADKVHTVIMTSNESEILNVHMTDVVNQHLEVPDMGIPIPYPILNDLFRGIKYQTMMCVGMLSNAGKSRFMFTIIAYLALVKKQKIGVLLNEMTVDSMKLCLLVSCINNPWLQELHGIKIAKKEKEIALGLYRDSKGEFIYRKRDKMGNFTESIQDYQSRLSTESDEYKNVCKVAAWIESETEGLIFAKDISTGYDDKSLEHEIRKMNMVNGIRLFFYDTLKSDTSSTGDWAALKVTTTILAELTRELNCFIYSSIQLTDETNYIKPHELTSSQISASKTIKHVLDELILCKEITAAEKSKYRYIQDDEDYGEPAPVELPDDKRVYCFVVDKNRSGDKKRLAVAVDLNLNTWQELGEIALRK